LADALRAAAQAALFFCLTESFPNGTLFAEPRANAFPICEAALTGNQIRKQFVFHAMIDFVFGVVESGDEDDGDV